MSDSENPDTAESDDRRVDPSDRSESRGDAGGVQPAYMHRDLLPPGSLPRFGTQAVIRNFLIRISLRSSLLKVFLYVVIRDAIWRLFLFRFLPHLFAHYSQSHG